MPHVDLPQAEFKVVLLGDTFTGKTSLVLRFAEGYYRESARSATVGAFFITKRLTVPSVGLTCKIQIWDTAGQEQFKPLAPMYYSNSAAAILCFDPGSPTSLKTLKYWLEELHRNVPAGSIVIAMAACKCDLLQNDSPTLEAKQALQEVEELAAQMGAIFVPTSAKNNENVTELFSRVAERVLQFQKNNKGSSSPMPVTLGGSSSPTNHGTGITGLVPRPDSTLPGSQQRARSTGHLPHTQDDTIHNPPRPASPHSASGMSMNREDYLHRRSHHHDACSSPTRRHWTDPSKMEGSPIVVSSTSAQQQQQQSSPTHTAASTMCGDTDYLSCAGVMPGDLYGVGAGGSGDPNGRCVIL